MSGTCRWLKERGAFLSALIPALWFSALIFAQYFPLTLDDLYNLWSASCALWHNAPEGCRPSPYALGAQIAPDEAVGRFLLAKYPPPAYALMAWFGFLHFESFFPFFRIISVLLIALSVWLLGKFYYSRSQGCEVAPVLPALFVLTSFPVYQILLVGQLTPFQLLPLSVFILLAGRTGGKRAALAAGLALSLTTIKGHLLYLIYIDFFLQRARDRNRALLAGFLAGLAALVLIPLFINPRLLFEFMDFNIKETASYSQPNLGSLLMWFFPMPVRFLASLPAIALVFFWRRRNAFSGNPAWLSGVLLPLSLFTTPYSNGYDFLLLLPTFMLVLSRVERSALRSFGISARIAGGALLIALNALGLTLHWQHHLVFYPAMAVVAGWWASRPEPAPAALPLTPVSTVQPEPGTAGRLPDMRSAP